MTFYLGIDVGSKSLDVALIAGTGAHACGERFANSPAGVKQLLKVLASYPVRHVVLEATGGYEQRALDALAARYPTTRVAAHRSAAFRRVLGRHAKTDRSDALVLAHMAQTIPPQPYVPADPAQRALRGLVKGRDQLVQQRDDNRRRIKQTESTFARRALERVNASVEKEIRALETQMRQAAAQCEPERAQRLAAVPGVGRITVATLIAYLPELGRCGNRQISALVGVAPYTQQSGDKDGRREIMAGRPFVRRVIYMAALAAIRSTASPLRGHYAALRARGKPAKVAIVACMRKLLITLNAILRHNTEWRSPTLA